MDALPEELQINIFHRLPIKSIGFCMCVNKNWLSLIKNPTFVSKNSRIKNKNNQHMMFWRNEMEFELRLDNDRFEFYKRFIVPPVYAFGFPVCDGMICLFERDGSVILWNPTIRKLLALPKPNLIALRDNDIQHFGFWFDSVTNDYKVIRILHPQVEIFSLNSCSWKTISKISLNFDIIGRVTLPILNGTLHWTAFLDHKYEFRSILGFDVNAEVFCKIELPKVMRQKYFKLSIYKETSIAICSGYNDDAEGGIWVMKEYGNTESWTKIYQYCPINRYCPNILGLLNNGRQLWEAFFDMYGVRDEDDDDEKYMMVFSIDSENGENRELALVPEFYFEYDNNVKYFEESLVLLDNVNATTL